MNTSPLDAPIHEAARKLLNLRMTRITGNCSDKSDADSLRDDLEALWTILDPMILAVGQYASAHFRISAADLKSCFTDQVRGALEGNATFVLEQAGDAAQAELCRSDYAEHNTLSRSLQGA